MGLIKSSLQQLLPLPGLSSQGGSIQMPWCHLHRDFAWLHLCLWQSHPSTPAQPSAKVLHAFYLTLQPKNKYVLLFLLFPVFSLPSSLYHYQVFPTMKETLLLQIGHGCTGSLQKAYWGSLATSLVCTLHVQTTWENYTSIVLVLNKLYMVGFEA